MQYPTISEPQLQFICTKDADDFLSYIHDRIMWLQTSERLVCVRLPKDSDLLPEGLKALQSTDIFRGAIQKALEWGCQGVRIMRDWSVIPYRATDDLNLEKFIGANIQDDTLATVSAADLTRLPGVLFSSPHHPIVVVLDGQLYFYKRYKPDFLHSLQKELDSYFQLRGSPYTLPIHALVSTSHLYAIPDDLRVHTTNAIDGFLIPFVGAHSTLYHEGEWDTAEKETLAVALIDAVLDTERRGVHLSDIKGPNTLIVDDGLKLIDIDDGRTSGYFDLKLEGSKATVFSLGRAIAELFVEGRPIDDTLPGNLFETVTLLTGTTEIIADLVKRCCEIGEFESVQHMYEATYELLQPIRARNLTVASLAAKRMQRIRLQTDSYDKWWLGRRPVDGVEDVWRSWHPVFQE